MRVNRFQKFLISLLIFCQLAFWPVLALAQVFGITTPATPTFVNDGTSTAVIDIPILAAIKAASIANQSCLVSDSAATAVSTASRAALGGLELISGGATLQATLSAEIVKLQAGISCHQAVLATLEGIITPDSLTANQKQIVSNSAGAAIASLKIKLESVNNQLTVAQGNVWKALLITVLINTTKSVANQLVNKLVNNYKITNIKAYTDSLATLAYDNQFIRDNFPDAQGQLMARAILTNPIYRTQIQPGIFVEAEKALGFDPNTLSTSDANYYAKMATVGATSADPYFLQRVYVDGVDRVRANSIATSQTHISQGNGYKAPVNCAGSLIQQNQIDLQERAASAQLSDRKALLTNLQTAQISGQTVKASDLAKAQADYNAALAAWNKVPESVGTSNPAIIMCEAVASPAVLVNQGIDAMFKAVGANISQYNSNNLPGFLNAISGIATQISSSMVLGGITGNSATVNEKQLVGQAVSATAAATVFTINNNAAANLAKGINLDATQNPSVTNGYTLNWDIVTSQITKASFITLTGPGINGTTSKLPLSGSYPVTTSSGGIYALTVYDATGKALTSATLSFVPSAQQAYNSAGPAVAGAYTNKPSVDIRGPVGVSLRGE